MNNEKRLRVAGYGRVSTDSKDQKNSYEHQKNSYDRDYKNNPLYIYNEKYLYFDNLHQPNIQVLHHLFPNHDYNKEEIIIQHIL